MEMLEVAALLVILLSGVFLTALGAASIVVPQRAVPFLESFAGSAFAHYLELCIRLVVGASFVVFARRMPLGTVFAVYGWMIVGTTICLFVVPWRWHRRFAQMSVPYIVRRIKLFGAVSFAAGALVLTAAIVAVFR